MASWGFDFPHLEGISPTGPPPTMLLQIPLIYHVSHNLSSEINARTMLAQNPDIGQLSQVCAISAQPFDSFQKTGTEL